MPFDKEFKKGYNKIIQFESSQGVEINYDIEVLFEDSGLSVESSNDNVVKNGNNFIFTGSFIGLKELNFNFR